jgi:hypothetical protein
VAQSDAHNIELTVGVRAIIKTSVNKFRVRQIIENVSLLSMANETIAKSNVANRKF